MKQVLFYLFALCTVTSRLVAQHGDPVHSRWSVVETEPAGAEVWLADSLLGTSPLRVALKSSDTLLLYYPGRFAWNHERAELAPPYLDVNTGVNRVVFRRIVRVRSTPSGAAVFRDDSLLGMTPCNVDAQDAALLRLRKPGFKDAVGITETQPGEAIVLLEPLDAMAQVPEVSFGGSNVRSPSLRVLLTAAAGLAAGIGAAALKQHADAEYEEYRNSGNVAALDRTRRADTYAGICLAVLELSVGYLVYLLFNDR